MVQIQQHVKNYGKTKRKKDRGKKIIQSPLLTHNLRHDGKKAQNTFTPNENEKNKANKHVH